MDILEITGSVTIRERIAIGDGVLTVKIVDKQGEVLAATAVAGSGVPREYAVQLDPELVTNSDELLLWAVLRTNVGTWGTLDLAEPGEDVLLTRIEG